jgi:hypothetical protein
VDEPAENARAGAMPISLRPILGSGMLTICDRRGLRKLEAVRAQSKEPGMQGFREMIRTKKRWILEEF